MTQPFAIELHLLSHPDYLCIARAAIGAAVRKIGFADEDADKIEIAVDEALSNIIRHGYGGARDRPITLRLRDDRKAGCAAFTIIVDDEAEQVDPERIRGRDLDDVRPGGLGVNIIRAVMDRVEYTTRPEGGMRLTMIKSAAASPTGATSSLQQRDHA